MPATITWTLTDESPRLASAVFLPIVEAYLGSAGITLDIADISLAARILAANNQAPDDLGRLGALARSGQANIVKLPNISASVGQIEACIEELNDQGETLPSYADEPTRYDSVKGSAVNPVLREGNSDRRAPDSVKAQAKANPHWMGEWQADSKTQVLTMQDGDFRHTEQSVMVDQPGEVHIVFIDEQGNSQALRAPFAIQSGEILDAAVMRAEALHNFLTDALAKAEQLGDVVIGAHLKATMMKVSDPVIFERVVTTWISPRINAKGIETNAWAPGQGVGALADEIGQAAVSELLSQMPPIAMADANAGLATLAAPNTTIIDASMPALIRAGGKSASADGQFHDTLAVIPDSSYAGLYEEIIAFCKANGAFDPATLGTVPNVGLMAQKAEEYGSHDKTFIIDQPGHVEIRDAAGTVLTRHQVAPGDIWRACQTKEAPIRDWVRLALRRAQATGWPAIFWLDADRPHDAQIRAVVTDELARHDTRDVELYLMGIKEATAFSVQRMVRGENTISVTGNVLRDYLTDMFPIVELGTSSRMLSIVPLMAGGGLYETGAGGTAPLLVRQLLDENHLQWDSLGEYMALVPALEQLAQDHNLPEAATLASTLDTAILGYLQGGHTPQAEVGQNDTRTAGYWIARLWAQALTEQHMHPNLAEQFTPLANALVEEEATLLEELLAGQGREATLSGYYRFDPATLDAVMRPSPRFNSLISTLGNP